MNPWKFLTVHSCLLQKTFPAFYRRRSIDSRLCHCSLWADHRCLSRDMATRTSWMNWASFWCRSLWVHCLTNPVRNWAQCWFLKAAPCPDRSLYVLSKGRLTNSPIEKDVWLAVSNRKVCWVIYILSLANFWLRSGPSLILTTIRALPNPTQMDISMACLWSQVPLFMMSAALYTVCLPSQMLVDGTWQGQQTGPLWAGDKKTLYTWSDWLYYRVYLLACCNPIYVVLLSPEATVTPHTLEEA